MHVPFIPVIGMCAQGCLSSNCITVFVQNIPKLCHVYVISIGETPYLPFLRVKNDIRAAQKIILIKNAAKIICITDNFEDEIH